MVALNPLLGLLRPFSFTCSGTATITGQQFREQVSCGCGGNVWLAFKRLFFGFALLALTSSVLLISDWHRRQSGTRHIPHVAILQQASQPIIDEGVQGMLDGLAESGFTDEQSITIRRYNAEGDIATANAIAKEITSGQFDLVLTATTLSLQAVANANKAGKTPMSSGWFPIHLVLE
jgi:hypothetical protein